MNKPMLQGTPLKDVPRPAEHHKAAAMPRWVLVTLVILLLGVLLFAILHLTGHGMGGMHMSIPDARRFLL